MIGNQKGTPQNPTLKSWAYITSLEVLSRFENERGWGLKSGEAFKCNKTNVSADVSERRDKTYLRNEFKLTFNTWD